jgi:hypothetical protein
MAPILKGKIMFDILGELGSSFPWIYRGWVYLLSSDYRNSRQNEWDRRGKLYRYIDISLSVVFILLEIIFPYLIWKQVI